MTSTLALLGFLALLFLLVYRALVTCRRQNATNQKHEYSGHEPQELRQRPLEG